MLNKEIFKEYLFDIDYDDVCKNSIFDIYHIESDVNFIVPVKGRYQFIKPLHKSYLKATKKTTKCVTMTIVEMSPDMIYRDFCKKNKINYIFIKSDLFNKCLAMNIGAIFSSKSNSFIFHDLDCLIQDNFFINLFLNIESKKSKAIQSFTDRRVSYLNSELTDGIIRGDIDINDIDTNTEGVKIGKSGAPGGSIYIDKNTFYEVGGFDPELFSGHSPEDKFFWEKVSVITEIHSCDDPINEVFHMEHDHLDPRGYLPLNKQPIHIKRMFIIMDAFIQIDYLSKLEMIFIKKNRIKDFYDGCGRLDIIENLIINELYRNKSLIYFSKKISEESNDFELINIESRKEGIFPIENITVRKPGNVNRNTCCCGEPIDKIKYNYCQKCNKIY